jgi:serine/threonine-protein kinase
MARNVSVLTDRWSEIEWILDEALEHEPGQWQAVLTRCTADHVLQQAVASLLERCQRIDGFIDRPAALKLRLLDELRSGPPCLAGRVVGRYRLVREIGRGGMARVWLAERLHAPSEHVAVKLMYPWVASAEIVRRFEQERRILESLAHPNIARLLETSVTDDGQACMILEYVDGRPIDRFCKEQQLGTRARLLLVRTVAEALAYAHRHQVVHRDLKPSNILVTANGDVKLLDFGIAKVLAAADRAAAEHTVTGQHWVTPSHAAPEQLCGKPVTVATDTFQLGVVLYQLLTSRRPFEDRGSRRTNGRGPHTTEAEPPSRAVLHDQSLEQHERRLRADVLRGDLDAIVLRAVRQDARERYASAADLAHDIHRFLNGEPVAARAALQQLHAREQVRQHRWGLMAAGAAVLFVAGYAVSLALPQRTERAASARRSTAELARSRHDTFGSEREPDH